MIDINTFKELDLKNQTDILFNEGKYLGVRSFYNYLINVHLLSGHLIEVWYCRERNTIEKIDINDDTFLKQEYELLIKNNEISQRFDFSDILSSVARN